MNPPKQRPAVPPGHAAEFRAENRSATAQAIWVVTIIALLLYPSASFVDWGKYPEQGGPLTWVRYLTLAAILVLLGVQVLLRKLRKDAAAARLVTWTFAAINCASLDVMNLMVGGPATPYFAGISLLLTALLVALPWSVAEMSVLVLAIVVQYDATMLLSGIRFDLLDLFIANFFHLGTCFIGLLWTFARYGNVIREFLMRKEIEAGRRRSDDLLLNILPAEVAEELKASGRTAAKSIASCSILFTDFVGFTPLASATAPDDLVRSLDTAFSRFDEIADRFGLEKLKTVGDGYMCAAGVTSRQPDHLLRAILAGLEMLEALDEEQVVAPGGSRWQMRVGVHSGPVVAGIIGRRKFAFDLWGDTVNVASRLVTAGTPGVVTVASEVLAPVDRFFISVERGLVPVRGKAPISLSSVTRVRPEHSGDVAGLVASASSLRPTRDTMPA